MKGKIWAAVLAVRLIILPGVLFAVTVFGMIGAADNAAWADDGSRLEKFLQGKNLPNVKNPPEKPAVAPIIDENGLYRQKWEEESFLDLREDLREASAKGKRLMVIFEQKGCIYCKRFHTQVMSKKYINDYARQNFVFIQINMWGDREVTDFDGKVMSEKQLARRWGVFNTPTAYFMPEKIPAGNKRNGRELAVLPAFYPGAFGPLTTFDMFVWVRIRGYESGLNFQRFHIRRLKERGLD